MDKQLEIIKKGAVEIIKQDDLVLKLKSKTPLRVKWGADPSAPDIHLGHLVSIRKLKQFQDMGHKIIFLIGDFTGMIGDPAGRSKTRRALTDLEVEANAKTYKNQIFKILDPEKTEVVFNSHWLSKMSLEDAIKLASKYTVARMLERDDFCKRFNAEEPISVHEFLYPFLQAYDSVHLKADIEIGGTDQKFNLLLGREIQKEYGQLPQTIITMPLLEGLDGVNKMSKSLGNYIGVTEPPKEIFGKVMSISDVLMIKYFELLTDEDIRSIKKMHPMEAKKKLGRILVTMFHDLDKAEFAQSEFEKVHSRKELPDDIIEATIPASALDEKGDITVVSALVEANLASSNANAKRLIGQGGVSIDGVKVEDANQKFMPDGKILKVGKRFIKKLKI